MNPFPDSVFSPGDAPRLLQLRTALPAVELLPERATMREAVGRPFELALDCLCPCARLDLEALVGKQMTVRLRQADGAYAPWHGYVLEAAQLGSDGGLARYRLTLGPWLAWLGLRLDSSVFQDRTALEVVEAVFAGHPAAQWRLQVAADARAAMRRRDLCVQYRETDLAFVERLLAQEGLHYWFEHLDADAAAAADREGRARHVLVIADAVVERADLGPIRLARRLRSARTRRPEDPIDTFAAEHRLAAHAAVLGSWDCARLAGTAARASSARDPGATPELETYDGSGADRYEDAAAAERAAALAQAATDLQAERFAGTGAARRLRSGARFTLIDSATDAGDASSDDDDDDGRPPSGDAFAVLAVEHEIRNDLGHAAAPAPGRPGGPAGGTYRNRFACVRQSVPVVPPAPRAPTAPAALTARVVGVRDAGTHADRDHRVKVRMHFQRARPSGADGPPAGPGADAAPDDERSGAWVRVAGPAAGAGWGSVYTPRIGAEVAIAFIEGDIDRPVVTGGLHDGTEAHPFDAGIGGAAVHPGVIGGLHSRTLGGEGFNQLALDDTPGRLRARLHSSHAEAELGLGHLVRQAGRSAQRGAARGTGFEAGTADRASVRAAQGLLLSATARAGTYGSARGSQMDAAEAVARLQDAHRLGRRLDRAARAARAPGLGGHGDGQAVDAFLAAVDPARDGRHADPAADPSAPPPGADGRAAGAPPVPAFARPVAVLDTPASLLATSDASVSAFAAEAFSLVAQGGLVQAAAGALSQASGGAASLYAHRGGLHAAAARGPVALRAHADALELLAGTVVTVASTGGDIRIGARQRIELVAGRSSIVLDGGDIEIKTPGAFAAHGTAHVFEGPDRRPAELPALPEGATGQAPHFIEVTLHDEALVPMAGYPYLIVFADGGRLEGVLDAHGHARHDGVPPGTASVFFGDSPAEARLAPVRALQVTDESLAADLRRLGLAPDALESLLPRASGRTA